MKSEKEILTDYMQAIISLDQIFFNFFKLKSGEDCFGEIKLVDNDFVHFDPNCYDSCDEELEKYNYKRCYENDEFTQDGDDLYILIPLYDIDLNNLYYWSEKFSCFVNSRWSFEQECWINNETMPGSISFSPNHSEKVKDDKCLKEIGYWQSDEWRAYLPHPKHLVELGWREDERANIISYLRTGHECGHWGGWSYCRFGCFCSDQYRSMSSFERSKHADELRELAAGERSMGCLDLTDGEWVWPEGLAHYVEKHNVCLPDEFIFTMQKNSWSIPARVNFQHRSQVGVSSLFWIDWSIKYFKAKQK
jgi:hypothetical protein